jgi:hypothetical protein
MQQQSILLCVQFKYFVNSPEKQTIAGVVSPRVFSWTCMVFTPFYDEVFPKCGYSNRPFVLVSSQGYMVKAGLNYSCVDKKLRDFYVKWCRFFVQNSVNLRVGT